MVMRRTAMKRTSFRRQAPVRIALPVDDDLVVTLERIAPRLYRVPAPSTPVFCPQPKRDYVRSEALLEAVRRVPTCMLCGRVFVGGEHADPAHSNWSGHGKAGGIKADDNRIAALCRTCHEWMDASGDDWLERFNAWWRAHVRTVDFLVNLLLWPRRVPVPDTLTYPKELS
jgi:hypothetical protein